MKLYRVSWSDESHGLMQRWFPSHTAARKGIPAIKAMYEEDKDWTFMLDIKHEEVPTKKAELIEWLNARFDTDNG